VSDVVISYARSTETRVRHIEEALRALGYSVWRDDQLPANRAYSPVIEEHLQACKAVLVIWSADAAASEWVRAEADVGRNAAKLVQVSLDATLPPLPFNQIQCARLKGWHPGRKSPEWDKIVAAIEELATRPAAAPPPPARPHTIGSRLLIAIALVVIAALAGGGAWLSRGLWPAAAPLRIALLPLRAASGSAAAQAVAESLTNQLQSALQNGPVEVLSPDAAAALSGAGQDEAARRLGVGLIVGGDVTDDGKTIDVTLRLDDAPRRVTLWTSQISGSASQSDAVTSHAGHLALTVLGCASSALKPGAGLDAPQALSLFFKACDLDSTADVGTPQLLFQMLDDLRQVTRLAPNFAAGHSMLASRLSFVAPSFPGDPSALLAEARSEANRALALDPTDAEAYVALSNLAPVTDWSGRQALLGRALAAHPDSPLANAAMALLLADVGRIDEATGYMQRAAGADPFDDGWVCEVAKFFAGAGRNQEANALLAQLVGRSPQPTFALWGYQLQVSVQEADWSKVSTEVDQGAAAGWLLPEVAASFRDLVAAAQSRTPEAIAKVRSDFLPGALHGSPTELTWAIFQLSSIGLVDDAYTLAAHYMPGSWFASSDPVFLFMPAAASMRRDPRFMPLMQRLGLLKYWRDSGKWPDFCSGPGLPYDCRAEAARLL
jgi:TolB-like protein/tetratricopeptide (TPR) repeat protein